MQTNPIPTPADDPAEHYHSGGSAGPGPGEHSAGCICGITFSGFDSQREVLALLEQHIAASGDEAPDHDPDDYWVQLSVALHSAADKVLALAGTPSTPGLMPTLYLSAGYGMDPNTIAPVIDALAAAFGVTAKTTTDGRGVSRRTQRQARAAVGPLGIRTYAYLPNPPTREERRANLAARNAELEAELAAARAELAQRGGESR